MDNIIKNDRRTQKRRIGDLGEDSACKYLEKCGYRIVDRNFACKSGEIDIIAIHPAGRIISFIEVKSRSSNSYGLPCQAVNYAKQCRIKKTAEYYLLCHPKFGKLQPSFDIFELLNLNGSIYVRYLKNAF